MNELFCSSYCCISFMSKCIQQIRNCTKYQTDIDARNIILTYKNGQDSTKKFSSWYYYNLIFLWHVQKITGWLFYLFLWSYASISSHLRSNLVFVSLLGVIIWTFPFEGINHGWTDAKICIKTRKTIHILDKTKR